MYHKAFHMHLVKSWWILQYYILFVQIKFLKSNYYEKTTIYVCLYEYKTVNMYSKGRSISMTVNVLYSQIKIICNTNIKKNI